jgi:hypothetical protein
MEQLKHLILKTITGETVIGTVVQQNKTSLVLNRPLIYNIITFTTPTGQKIKEILVFKPWCEFIADTQITFKTNTIMGSYSPSDEIINFYNQEINRPKIVDKKESQEQPDQQPLKGNLNFNMEFGNAEDLQMFMESVQFGLDNLMEGMDPDEDLEEAEDTLREYLEEDATKPAKKAKKKKKKKTNESFNLPYNENGDPTDPSSWSDNPNDYLK